MTDTTAAADSDRRAVRLFVGLVAIYFVANMLLRLLLPSALELDEAQQIFVAQWLSPGYGTQPPFYNWVQYGVIAVFGPSIFSLTLLKNLTLFSSYLMYFSVARLTLRRADLAAVAALGLLTVPQISFEAQRDLTHTVAVIFSACLFLFFLIRTIEKPTLSGYAATGLAIGIGFISKYNFVLLPVSALAAMLVDRSMRHRVLDWRILATFLLASLIALPHLVWLAGHLETATQGTMSKLADTAGHGMLRQIGRGLISFLGAILGFATATVVLFLIVYKRQLTASFMSQNRWTLFFERLLIAFAAMIVLLVIFAGAGNIKDRWLTPVMLVLPLYLCLKMQAGGWADTSALRRFLPIAIAIMVIVPALLGGRIVAAGLVRSYQKLNIPYQAFAAAVGSQYRPAAIIAGDGLLAGSLRLQFPDVPVLAPKHYPAFNPPVEVGDGRPALMVWRDDGEGDDAVPNSLALWLTENGSALQAGETRHVGLPYAYGASEDRYEFHYIWLTKNSANR